MSRVMYSYRLPKEAWWEFARECRKVYAASHPVARVMVQAAQAARAMPPDAAMSKLADILAAISKMDDWMVDLQVFDQGDTWLVRPLERGYFFLNNHGPWVSEYGLEPLFYDDRSDVPLSEEGNRDVSVWCDTQVAAGDYFLHTVMSEDSLSSMVFSAILESTA